jgi:hypothetical protein
MNVISGVNDTGDKKDNFEIEFFFSHFVKSLVGSTLHLHIHLHC